MRHRLVSGMLWVGIGVLGAACTTGAVTLTVGGAEARVGELAHATITVDEPERIVGAVFDVVFDATCLAPVAVDSGFFDTFARQLADVTPAPPDHVTLGPNTYTRPLVAGIAPDRVRVAASRAHPGTTGRTLLTVTFRVLRTGASSVTLAPAIVAHTPAGYPGGGVAVPMLFALDTGAGTLAEQASLVALPVAAIVSGTVGTPGIDSDGDGLPDAWEFAHFGTLDQGPNQDYDEDGLSNAEEYAAGTMPNHVDSDGDGLPDTWEIAHGLDPVSAAGKDGAGGDPDGDDYSNIEEYVGGGAPFDADVAPAAIQWAVMFTVATHAATAPAGAVPHATWSLLIGMAANGTDAFDPTLDQMMATPRDSGDAEAYFLDPITLFPLWRDCRSAAGDAAWRLHLRVPPGHRLRIAWNPEAWPAHVRFEWHLTDGAWANAGEAIDGRTGTFEIVNTTDTDRFHNSLITAERPEPVSFHVDLAAQTWHLLSLPLVPDTGRAEALFPDVAGAWAWDTARGRYRPARRLRSKLGYWLWLNSPVAGTISGFSVASPSVRLAEGWNLVAPAGNVDLPLPEGLRAVWSWNSATGSYMIPDGAAQLGRAFWMFPLHARDIWTE